MMRTIPWWLWPHALGLDAALVAVFWQLVFTKWLGISPHAGEAMALGCGVWSLYLLDRVWDVTRRPSPDLTDDCQHGLARRFPGRLAVLSILLAALGGGAAITSLNLRQIDVLFILIVAVGSYYVVLARRSASRSHSPVLRSLVVGLLFVTGCCLLPWLRNPVPFSRIMPAWLATGAVFAANVLLCDASDENRKRFRKRFPEIFVLAAAGGLTGFLVGFWPAVVAGIGMVAVALVQCRWHGALADALLVCIPLGFLVLLPG